MDVMITLAATIVAIVALIKANRSWIQMKKGK